MDSGCRKSEGRFLEWSRIAWENNPNWHPHENPQAVVTLHATETKSRRPRRVPLPKRTAAIIKRLRDEFFQRLYPDADPASALALAKIKGVQLTGGVFMYRAPAARKPTWRAIGDIKTGFNRACQRAGITDFTIHDLRHHYASRLAQAGRSLQDIRDLLGHANTKMPERYAHLCRTNLGRAVDALDA
jgi:integrase